ncbi:Threonine dehydrogenase or related Zn-dependent dehydrogenase [Halorhabdus sp. BNX81]|nr:Threonine dehydrogenase or related Zn-dependent dehydrogenase [Halorhabdus sp. BNX81]
MGYIPLAQQSRAMQTAVLTEDLEFEFEERERPTPASDEVLVEMTDVGICKSDVHYWEHGRIGDYVVEDPLLLGHESAGVIAAVGDDVEGIDVGDRVALEPGIVCGTCEHCRRGEYNLCPNVDFMATPPFDGAFAEYVAWPANLAHVLPDSVSQVEGALCEPFAVGLHATRRGSVGHGDTVAILGGGTVGSVTMEAARAAGATDIIVGDIVDSKLERAEEHGADATVNVREGDFAATVEEYTDGRGADVVFEATDSEPDVEALIDAARRGGTVVMIGLADEATVEVDALEIITNELDVLGSFRDANRYGPAIDLLAEGAAEIEWIADFTEPLANVREAFERAHDDDDAIKGMISIGE